MGEVTRNLVVKMPVGQARRDVKKKPGLPSEGEVTNRCMERVQNPAFRVGILGGCTFSQSRRNR